MSTDCCAPDAEPSAQATDETECHKCPIDGSVGSPVKLTTVAAQVRAVLPDAQSFRLCRQPDCDVVYFGSRGAVFRILDLWVAPGFKHGGSGVLCYCFQLRRSDLAAESNQAGESSSLRRLRQRVASGACACEVRNPSGRCCLADIKRALA